MGLFSRVTDAQRITAAAADIGDQVTRLALSSPWADSTLDRMVFEDVFGTNAPVPVNRALAMSIPALFRGRNSMVSTVSDLPLRQVEGDQVTTEQPLWLFSTSGSTHPADRIAWTVDDLIFHGLSVWARVNDPISGFPIAVDRIRRDRWQVDSQGIILVDGHPVESTDVIVISGQHEGILSAGADALRDAKSLFQVVRQRLKNPAPQLVLKQTAGEPMTDAQIDALIARWAKAREGQNGGVGYVNQSLDVEELGGGGDAQLLIEARNAAAVDMARLVGVSASRVDATSPKSSLNYETTQGRNQEFVDLDVKLYTAPIERALSMDSVTPPGTRIAFDFTDFTALDPSPVGPRIED